MKYGAHEILVHWIVRWPIAGFPNTSPLCQRKLNADAGGQ
jgi:hypothetical protein